MRVCSPRTMKYTSAYVKKYISYLLLAHTASAVPKGQAIASTSFNQFQPCHPKASTWMSLRLTGVLIIVIGNLH